MLKTLLFPSMRVCMPSFSDICIWYLLQGENLMYSTCCEMFETWLTHGTTYKCLLQFDAWDFPGQKIMAKIRRPVAWLHDTVGPWTLWEHRIAPCIRSALTCVIVTFRTWCRRIWSNSIQDLCAKRARKHAKRAQKSAKRAQKKKCST